MADRDEVEALLDELQRDSEARRAELKEVAAALPEATSRRALIRSMIGSIAGAPDKPLVIKRFVLKVLRTPSDLVRRARARR